MEPYFILVLRETTVSDAITELNALTQTMQRMSDAFRDVGATMLHMGKVWQKEITVPTHIALVDVLNQILRSRVSAGGGWVRAKHFSDSTPVSAVGNDIWHLEEKTNDYGGHTQGRPCRR